ncbi:MAG TPA: DUF2252 family protein [Candidatus Dormibacteraeota bacterium]
MVAAAGPSRPDHPPRGAEPRPGARTGADPLGPNAPVALRLPARVGWYSRVDGSAASSLFRRNALSQYRRVISAARRRTSQRVLPRLTELTRNGGRRIVDHPPLITHDALCDDRDELAAILEGYRDSLSDAHRQLLGRFHLEDFARKVVGSAASARAATSPSWSPPRATRCSCR